MLLPYSGVFAINAFFAEHFIYLAGLGLFIVSVYFLMKIKFRPLFYAAFFIYLIFFSLVSIRYNFIWQDPIKFFERVVKLSPNSFAAYNNLGVLYLNRGPDNKTEGLFKKALEINPDFSEARLNLARYYYLKNDLTRAIGLAKGVLEEDPKNFLAMNFLGTFYLKNGQYDLAEGYFRRAIALKPGNVSLWLDLYSLYKLENKVQEEEAIRAKIRELDRYAFADLYLDEAKEALADNKADQALILTDLAIKNNPAQSGYYNFKGYLLGLQGKYPEAFLEYKKALNISSFNWEAYNNQGNLFARVKDFKSAKRNFKRAILLKNDFVDAYFNLGLLYFEEKEFKEAKENFEKVLTLNPSHALAKEYLNKIK